MRNNKLAEKKNALLTLTFSSDSSRVVVPFSTRDALVTDELFFSHTWRPVTVEWSSNSSALQSGRMLVDMHSQGSNCSLHKFASQFISK